MFRKRFACFRLMIYLMLLVVSNYSSTSLPIVKLEKATLKNGTIAGVKINMQAKGECNVFLGIPYAAAPLGTLRFRKPYPTSSWSTTISTTKYKSACMQPSQYLPSAILMNEDCLYLNVFSPDRTNERLPVLIWIHGGGFLSGTVTTISPLKICERATSNQIIIVTFNYRLGAFGFLSTNNDTSTNVGILDVKQAVGWVHENIESFGGDKERIFLSGHGSGAAISSLLSLDSNQPLTGFIMLSGSMLAPWAVTNNSKASTQTLLDNLQCSTVNCLRSYSAPVIIQNVTAPLLWSPERDVDTVSEELYKNLLVGSLSSYPIVHTLVANEGFALAVKMLSTQMTSISTVVIKVTEYLAKYFTLGFINFSNIYRIPLQSDNALDSFNFLSKVFTETLFHAPIAKEIRLRAKFSDKTFLYFMNKEISASKMMSKSFKLSFHGQDALQFWYDDCFMAKLLSPLMNKPATSWKKMSVDESSAIYVDSTLVGKNFSLDIPFVNYRLKNVEATLKNIRINVSSKRDQKAQAEDEKMLWTMLGLSTFFFFMFLFTATACAMWSRRSNSSTSTPSTTSKKNSGENNKRVVAPRFVVPKTKKLSQKPNLHFRRN